MRELMLLWQAYRALHYAEQKGISGTEFARFGRRIGWQLLVKRKPGAGEYLLAPVQSSRYFEYPFTWSCMPAESGNFLDVSSPRLFSLYTANHYPNAVIKVINPDNDDIRLTGEIADTLGFQNLGTESLSVDTLKDMADDYDCIWSISVIEHILTNSYDDRDAVRWMFDRLKPGGRLILTVPTDRTYWLEYRNDDPYGVQAPTEQGYFFQRFYDGPSIQRRIIDAVGQPPAKIQWYGERIEGHFHSYIESWRKTGRSWLVNDPQEMADHYTAYNRWEEMPGVGVCGLMFEKLKNQQVKSESMPRSVVSKPIS